jgi:beta-lactam-binding protein with PASTA domain
VTIPPLRGDSLGEATVKLQVLGLNVKVERARDDSLPPGEVLSSRPGEGATVLSGETVTLVVAEAPSTAPSRAQPSDSASH